ncbi:hypothetical protein KAS56_06305 [candidate division WOR-3 bacterium]|jgi:hypothetical protein|nr:hypothetical protein [candidate division WOR-3 bacterium]
MIEYLENWLVQVNQNYGVNPIIFAIIYFASVIPFWFSIYKIIAGLKNRNLNQVRTFGIILGIIIILPFIYVALFGHNLPFWFWIVAACVIGYSIYSTIHRIKSAK